MDGTSEVTPAPRPHDAGRPSTVAPYAPEVAQWLREDPDRPSIEILRRVRLATYRCGKNVLYELVRRLEGGRAGRAYRWVRQRALWWTDPRDRDEGLGMRLRSKIFLASALVIVVLAGVSALSLAAVGRLVSANREITTRAIPALSLTASAREAIPPLLGLEARAVVLGDQRYATAWTELAAQLAEDLERYGSHFAYLGDEERLHQLVVNLGANAIRFTPRGGRVVVRIIDASPEFELQVEDTGVGIPADALPSIFDPYRQAHQDRGGTGLGLAIVRGVANAHGGRVTAESHEGKGSRFTVLLPRS